MKWVTRERPKIDRIACPWLITRFIDKEAEFLYVPADQVLAVAETSGATPYDIPDVEYSHVGALCSFDAFISKHNLTDPALLQLAVIVRGRIRHGWILPRKPPDCWRYRWDCHITLRMTTQCWRRAW